MEFPWNSTGNPWESTGMAHSYHPCGFPVEFQHSMGFRRNLPELMEEGKVLETSAQNSEHKPISAQIGHEILTGVHNSMTSALSAVEFFWIHDTFLTEY